MIDVFLRQRRICVRLDPRSPYYERAYILVRSTLTAYEIEENLWTLSFHDLNMLRTRLDQVGLVEARTMTVDAHDWVSYLASRDAYNLDLKKGANVEPIQQALAGKMKHRLFEDQVPAVSYAVSNRRAGIFDEMGSGKAQPLDAKILTPTGWKLMGDMQVGNAVVNSAGGASYVTGVHPRGEKEVFEVIFNDGSRTRCCDDHLWKVNTSLRRFRGSSWRVFPLSEIRSSICRASGGLQHFVPMVGAVQFEEFSVPIHPYVLGALLGDGYLGSNVQISSKDDDLVYRVHELLPDSVGVKKVASSKYSYQISRVAKSGSNEVMNYLRDLGLLGKRSPDKFIPTEYLYNSIENRMHLLRGLMDTDGHVPKNAPTQPEFSTTSKSLAEGLVFLVQSVGGIARLQPKRSSFYTQDGARKKGLPYYRVLVNISNGFNPFWLNRKAAVWKPAVRYKPARAIKEVVSVGKMPTRCISVNAFDNLYVTDDFILTHNSLEALASVVVLGDKVRKTLLICPYTAQISFKREVQKHTGFKAIQVPSGRKLAFQFVEDNRDTEWDIMLTHPENLIGGQGRGNAYGDLTKLLRLMTWDMIIVDEFHLYKNLSAKRTKCVVSILNESRDREGKWPRALLLTGTPVSESPMNAYVALSVLTRDYLPHISKFEHHFVVKQSISYGSKGTHQKVVGFKNLDELKSMIEAVSIRRIKADMTGFPDRVSMIRDVELSGKQLALYKTICGEIVAGLPRSTRINLLRFLSDTTTVLRLRQVMNHPSLLDEDGDSAKYIEIDNLLEEILADPEQKVIIWTEFRKAVDNLHERYNPIYGACKLYGGVTNEQMERIAFDFENLDTPRVAVAIPAKAGTGLDFLARARTAIYVERPYSFTLYKQSIDRIHRRITSGTMSKLDTIRAKPATMIFLDVVRSVDELIRDRLFGKQDMADALTIPDARLVEMGRDDLLEYLR